MNVYKKEVIFSTIKLIEEYFHKEEKVFDYSLIINAILKLCDDNEKCDSFRNLVLLTLKTLVKISGVNYENSIPRREFIMMVSDIVNGKKLLTEGLIMTHNIDKSINVLKNEFKSAKIDKLTDSDFVVEIKGQPESFNLIVLARNLGYTCTYWEAGVNKGTKESELSTFSYNKITLFFEAKYDIDEDNVKEFYHVTPLVNWNKIKKIGLVPKSQSKRSYHPERVYLSKVLDGLDELAKMMYGGMYKKEYYKKWAVLKIVIPEDKEIVFNKDPNFPNGIYTLNNIHPDWIEKNKRNRILI